MFITSQSYNGNLGGLSGADAKCQELAVAANLPGTYKAWLSSSTVSARECLSFKPVPYVRPDGVVVVASGPGDFYETDTNAGDLNVAIEIDEKGGLHNNDPVWTNTFAGLIVETNSPFTCQDWQSSANPNNQGVGPIGDSYAEYSPQWTHNQYFGCNEQSRLYCFQQ